MGKDDFKIDLDFDLSKYSDYKSDGSAKVTLDDILNQARVGASEPEIKEAPVITDTVLTEIPVKEEPKSAPQLAVSEENELVLSAEPALEQEEPIVAKTSTPDFLFATDEPTVSEPIGITTEQPLFFEQEPANSETIGDAIPEAPDLLFGLGEEQAAELKTEEFNVMPNPAVFEDEEEEQSKGDNFVREEPACDTVVEDEPVIETPQREKETDARLPKGKKYHPEVVEEYSSIEEREDILSDLRHLLKKITTKTVVMFLLFLVGAYLTIGRIEPLRILLPDVLNPATNAKMYCLSFLCLTAICFVFNLSPLLDGLKKIFHARLTTDGASLCLGVCCIAFNIYFGLKPELFSATLINFDILFLLMLLMNLLGKRLLVKHILANFDMFSQDRIKTVISRPRNIDVNNDIMIETGDGGDIIYACKTKTVADYMKQAFAEQNVTRKTDLFYFVAYVLILAVGLILALFKVIEYHYILIFLTAALAICAPVFSSWTHTLGVYRLGKFLRMNGTMVSGREGAEALAESGVLVVRDTDLLSSTNIGLHGMRVRDGYDTKDILMYLSALFSKVGGPMDGFFGKILDETWDGSLPTVSDVYYHEQLGYTFVSDGKRINFGTADFMAQCGIKCPMDESGAKGESVFVSINGTIGAIFSLSYVVPKKTQKALALIDSEGLSLAIVTSDFLIRESTFAPYVSDPDMITVLSYESGMKCDSLCGECQSTSADVVTYDNVRGMALGMYGCSQLLANYTAHSAYKITSSVFGLIIMIVMGILLSVPSFWLPFQILAYQFIWSIPNYFRGLRNKV